MEDNICPDGGACHHRCADDCFRVKSCGPLPGVFPEDKWPALAKAKATDAERIERNYHDEIARLAAMPVTSMSSARGITFGRCRVRRWHEKTWRIEYPGHEGGASAVAETPLAAISRLLALGGVAPVRGLVVWSNRIRGTVQEVSHLGKRIAVWFDGEEMLLRYSFHTTVDRWIAIGDDTRATVWRHLVFLESEIMPVDRDG